VKTHKSIRWTKEQAASEFTINPRTLSNRLRQHGIEPGEDRKFSTTDICRAVFGDIDGEKLRLTREQADKLSLENAIARGDLITVKEAAQRMGKFFTSARQRVLSNPKLDEKEKDHILDDLTGLLAVALGQPVPDGLQTSTV